MKTSSLEKSSLDSGPSAIEPIYTTGVFKHGIFDIPLQAGAVIYPSGERAIVLEISRLLSQSELTKQSWLWKLADLINHEPPKKLHFNEPVQAILGLNNLTLFFSNTPAWNLNLFEQALKLANIWNQLTIAREDDTVFHDDQESLNIPVIYGGEQGPDLERLCDEKSLSKARFIQLHSEASYHVMFVGFQANFPYLHGTPTALRTARLATPRTKVAAGSVAIADGQTGIYPKESAGGWNVIGRVENLSALPTFKASDKIRFISG